MRKESNQKKLISVVTPCYNEEENVEEVYNQVRAVFKKLAGYDYEHIFIDNASVDRTFSILKGIAKRDRNVKIIENLKNFGWIRSPFYGIQQARGDAVIFIASDLQDPPAIIPKFLREWGEGRQIVAGVKRQSKENFLMFGLRKFYYNLMDKIADTEHIRNFTGFGLYDQSFIEILRGLDDPYPYLRGLVSELSSNYSTVEYIQPRRLRGRSWSNFYRLYDAAMLGFVNHSRVPLRMASFIGFGVALLSLLIAVGYLVYKLMFWNEFDLGLAPLVIGVFFFSAVQLFFIGIIGEYIGAIYTQVRKRPLVIEKERINF